MFTAENINDQRLTAPNLQDPRIVALAQQLAQEMLANLIQGLGNGVATAPAALDSLDASIPLWVASLKAKRYSPQTIKLYEHDVRHYLAHDPCPTALSIQAYVAKRLDEVSPARVATERKALVSFFRCLHKGGLVPADPTANLDSFGVTYKERELPAREDIAKLLQGKCYRESDTAKFRTMVLLLANTGLRAGEACAIRTADIDFERLEIKVMGKGRKLRTVPIAPHVAQALKAWLERDGHSEWLFPGNNANGYWDRNSFDRTFKRQCQRYGIKPFVPHTLRHNFATHCLRRGAPIQVVSRILGHASIAITVDTYTHIDKQEMHETCKRYAPNLTADARQN